MESDNYADNVTIPELRRFDARGHMAAHGYSLHSIPNTTVPGAASMAILTGTANIILKELKQFNDET
jgi:hypothetical protein